MLTIRKEIAKENYQPDHDKPTTVSAIGAVPKPDSDDVGLIHDYSMPQGQEVNDYICPEKFSFLTLGDAIKLVKPNSYMAKIYCRFLLFLAFHAELVTLLHLLIFSNLRFSTLLFL